LREPGGGLHNGVNRRNIRAVFPPAKIPCLKFLEDIDTNAVVNPRRIVLAGMAKHWPLGKMLQLWIEGNWVYQNVFVVKSVDKKTFLTNFQNPPNLLLC